MTTWWRAWCTTPPRSRVGDRRCDDADALTEPDGGRARALSPCPEPDFVTVFEKHACFPVGQRDRLSAATTELQQAAFGTRIGSGERATAEQVAGLYAGMDLKKYF